MSGKVTTKNLMNAINNDITPQKTQPAETTPAEKKTKLPKNSSILLRTDEETKDRWTSFFDSKDLSLAQGIRRAVNYYIKQVESGNIEL